MTAANIIGMTNFFVKSRKLSIILIGMQAAYLIYKMQTNKSKKIKKSNKRNSLVLDQKKYFNTSHQ